MEPTIVKLPYSVDIRGRFLKPFAKSHLQSFLPEFSFSEVFFSVNHANVIRGFHFQNPPHDHGKFVFALTGRILDVIIDLRAWSPKYGKVSSYELIPEKAVGLFIPKGFGHAFLSLEEDSTIGYFQETERIPESEGGILWNSVDFVWPIQQPILSERDSKLLPFYKFTSPWNQLKP